MNEGEDLTEGTDESIRKTKKAFKKHKDPCSSSKNAKNSSNDLDQFNDYVGTFLKDALDGRPGVTVIESLENAYSIDSTANITLNTR